MNVRGYSHHALQTVTKKINEFINVANNLVISISKSTKA